MTEAEERNEDEVTLFAMATTLLRNRWRVLRWMLIGAVIAVLPTLLKPALFVGSASFVPQGSDANRSGLASLAGQFGVSLPAGNQSLSPDIYVRLLTSRAVLGQVARDTFAVQELADRRISFLDLFNIPGGASIPNVEKGVKVLSGIVKPSVSKVTGIVDVSVATEWPSVSLGIITALVSEVNVFNQRMRQEQAAAEATFAEGRLTAVSGELRAAEDRLGRFLTTNRQSGGSASLEFERERLQRDVALHQEIFTSITRSFEDARIIQVRDTPVITVVDQPSVSTIPEPRGRGMRLLVGLLLGGLVGALIAFISDSMTRHRHGANAELDEFVDSLNAIWDGIRVYAPQRKKERRP